MSLAGGCWPCCSYSCRCTRRSPPLYIPRVTHIVHTLCIALCSLLQADVTTTVDEFRP